MQNCVAPLINKWHTQQEGNICDYNFLAYDIKYIQTSRAYQLFKWIIYLLNKIIKVSLYSCE